ncbi:YciI family protein [Chitinophaga sp. Cy-1792]|uniref:YciI family protein n=1 Tax=Chitinophaga sp. Cy-1792 TaxID=2608339 RepID=UPI0014222FFF|nr:YciI family protein [Chitinophaga sp. Cy-1792]NIG57383.1 hypothetical protein [Chitinophaga sp. Cy-1792]
MASKVIPAVFLLCFLIVVIVSFRPSPFPIPALSAFLSAKFNTDGQSPDMKKYWIVFLKRGPHPDIDAQEAQALQQLHLKNIGRLSKEGKIIVSGPFGDTGTIRGLYILDCKDSMEAERLVNTDPAVKAGRLTYEIRSWWTSKKSCVFK